MRVKVTMACTNCKQRNYVTKKNKRTTWPNRNEQDCKFAEASLHKETK